MTIPRRIAQVGGKICAARGVTSWDAALSLLLVTRKLERSDTTTLDPSSISATLLCQGIHTSSIHPDGTLVTCDLSTLPPWRLARATIERRIPVASPGRSLRKKVPPHPIQNSEAKWAHFGKTGWTSGEKVMYGILGQLPIPPKRPGKCFLPFASWPRSSPRLALGALRPKGGP